VNWKASDGPHVFSPRTLNGSCQDFKIQHFSVSHFEPNVKLCRICFKFPIGKGWLPASARKRIKSVCLLSLTQTVLTTGHIFVPLTLMKFDQTGQIPLGSGEKKPVIKNHLSFQK
jgi:hypothetical protein